MSVLLAVYHPSRTHTQHTRTPHTDTHTPHTHPTQTHKTHAHTNTNTHIPHTDDEDWDLIRNQFDGKLTPVRNDESFFFRKHSSTFLFAPTNSTLPTFLPLSFAFSLPSSLFFSSHSTSLSLPLRYPFSYTSSRTVEGSTVSVTRRDEVSQRRHKILERPLGLASVLLRNTPTCQPAGTSCHAMLCYVMTCKSKDACLIIKGFKKRL